MTAKNVNNPVKLEALRIYGTTGKIEAVKYVFREMDCGLKAAKDLVESWVERANTQEATLYCGADFVRVNWSAGTVIVFYGDGREPTKIVRPNLIPSR